jgi:hypothetical protein
MNTADLRSLLLADAGVAAILTGGEVFPVHLPREAWDQVSRKPCVVVRLNGVARSRTFCATESLAAYAADLDIYAREYDACNNLANAVRSAVTDFRGLVGASLFGPIHVETEVEFHEPDPGLYRRVLTLTIWSIPQ